MTLSNNELKKIQTFHKKMQQATGLKGNKFANNIMSKLLKNRSPWKRGGGTRNNQLGPPRGPNVDLVDDVGGYIERLQRTDRNQTNYKENLSKANTHPPGKKSYPPSKKLAPARPP